jgi:hypothetical protein
VKQRALGISHIHQAHERGHGIEARPAEGQQGPIADEVANAPPVLRGGCCDEQLRDIEGSDTGAPARQQAGVVSLTAAQIKTQQPIHRRQQRENAGVFTKSR